MLNLIKPIALGAVLALSAPAAFAKDVRFLIKPSGGSLPLFVLQAKAADFLPKGTNIVFKADAKGKEDIVKALKTKSVDYTPMFHGMGAMLHSKGLKHLKLAGIHAWGGVAILSKTSIAPGDWTALKGTMGLITPGIKTPPHKTAMAAMMVQGVNPKADLMFAGSTPGNAFAQMKSADNAPDFVVMAEPQLSHGLIKMKKGNWPTQYHVFADTVRSVSHFGMPLSGLWIVGEQEDAAAIVAGFDKAVDYMFDPANRVEVAAIISQGFTDAFGKNAPPKVFENMLERGLLRMDFKSAAAMEAKMRMVWAKGGMSPSRDIIWHGNDFKIPGQPFLVSQMLPRHVGISLAYGDQLGLTKKTQIATIRIREWAHKPMFLQLQKMRKAEAAVLQAYLVDDWKTVDTLLQEMAAIRLESSRIQIECIKRTQKMFDPVDVEKIRKFMEENADIAAAFGGL